MKRIIFATVLMLMFAGCATHSGRFTLLEVDNRSPEKMTASRDVDMVIYDRGYTEFSEGHVESGPEYEDGEEPSWVMDVWTALVSILPDWNVRVTVCKAEWDVLQKEEFVEDE